MCCRTHQKKKKKRLWKAVCFLCDSLRYLIAAYVNCESGWAEIFGNQIRYLTFEIIIWVKSVSAEFLFQVYAGGKSAPKWLCSKRVLVLLDQSQDIPASEVIKGLTITGEENEYLMKLVRIILARQRCCHGKAGHAWCWCLGMLSLLMGIAIDTV